MCKKQLFFTIVFLLIFFLLPVAKAWSIVCPTDKEANPCENLNEQQCSDVTDACSKQVFDLTAQVETVKGNIALTGLRITQTELQIENLTNEIASISGKIDNLEGSLTTLSNVLIERIIASYKNSSHNNLGLLMFNSGKLYDLLVNLRYLQIVQRNDQKILLIVETTKVNYTEQKKVREQKKQEQTQLEVKLASQKIYLAQQKDKLQKLLTTTQSTLDTARAQLEALRSFAHARVGPSGGIISHQDLSDSWGKYYNQRDANWGNNYIGSSNYQIWEAGCLLTSFAMVSSHFGGSITPGEVAANTSNFDSGLFRIPGPSANGHGADYVTNPSLDTIINYLKNGNIIIAGLSANGGFYPQHYSDHWVVLRSLDGDTIKINDPFYEGAMNVSLGDHYGGWSIIEARIYH